MTCELCDRQARCQINNVPYCDDHRRDGIDRQTRLLAWQRGCPRDVIDRAAAWAVNEYDRAC